MRNLLFSVSLFLMTTSAIQSQNTIPDKLRFAVLGGVNFQNFTGINYFGDSPQTSMIIGFHAGINAQIPLVSEFYFQPGLLFSVKGAQIKENTVTGTFRLSYIELPLNLVYKGKLGTGSILLGFGPYVAYGISGSAVYKSPLGDTTSPVEFKSIVNANDPLTNTYFKALDLGGSVFAGYEMAGGLFLQLNSQFGMVNISPEDNRIPGGKTNLKNIGFGLSLGYRL
jgi:hypothetical protein